MEAGELTSLDQECTAYSQRYGHQSARDVTYLSPLSSIYHQPVQPVFIYSLKGPRPEEMRVEDKRQDVSKLRVSSQDAPGT